MVIKSVCASKNSFSVMKLTIFGPILDCHMSILHEGR